jgi:hypothetical protein
MKPFVGLPNYAGKSGTDLNAWLKNELECAGIEAQDIGFALKGEVGTSIIGTLHRWTFKRAWRYWVCDGPGVPLAAATALHNEYGNQVRVDGHCGCPSPLEQFKGLGTGSYHVDSQIGLKALADTIKAVVSEANVTNQTSSGAR